jgi:cytochrome P450
VRVEAMRMSSDRAARVLAEEPATQNQPCNPAELAKLRADPALINAVVEEALRYDPPVDATGRVASRDLEVSAVRSSKRRA